MKNLVEELLKIKTYEEFDRRREEFRGLPKNDSRVGEHLNKIFPKINDGVENGIIVEVYEHKPEPR